MIIPTLVSVRKNSSSSSNAISGAGMLPFMTPTSMIWRGSTWPVIPGALATVAVDDALTSGSPVAFAWNWNAWSAEKIALETLIAVTVHVAGVAGNVVVAGRLLS